MEQLPEELVCKVIQAVRRSELANLVLVNKRLCRIATPSLYSACVFSELARRARFRAISYLLRSLLANSRLGALVQHVRVGDWKTENLYGKITDMPAVSIVDLSTVVQSMPAISSFPLAFQSKLRIGMLQSKQDAITAATLSLLSNLTSMTMDVDYRQRDLFKTEELLTSYIDFNDTITVKLIEPSTTPALKDSSLFDNLKQLSMNANPWEGHSKAFGWDVRLVSVFMQLPSLQEFSGRGCRDVGNDSNWACPDGTSTVTEIELYDCIIGTGAIRQILRSARALKSFECLRADGDCLSTMGHATHQYSYAILQEDLLRHRGSLQKLRLGSKSCPCPVDLSSLQYGPIDFLQSSSKLTFVELDENALIGNRGVALLNFNHFMPLNLDRIVIRGEFRSPQPL